MDINKFIKICDTGTDISSYPENWHPLQKALALERAGNWDAAHRIAQNDNSSQGNAIHAYLHRKEGDEWNAHYWYRRTGRAAFCGSLEEEWMFLASEFLD